MFSLKKPKEFVMGSRNQLRYKIFKDSFKYFIISYLILFIVLFFLNLKNNSILEALIVLKGAFFASLLSLIIMGISLKLTFEKHLLKRFDIAHDEMKAIKKGDFSKRLSIDSDDEISEMNYFTNKVLEEFQKKIEFEKNYALMDPLTLCYNRRSLGLAFSKFASRIKRKEKVSFSFLMFDIDNFKKVNDTYGHSIGDKVLIHLAKAIRKTLRNEDTIYRVGGEEFVVLFFKLPKTKEKALFSRLQQNLTYELAKKVPQITSKITVSGGVVHSKDYNLTDKKVLEKMLHGSDKLLYKAKNSGKNKILFS